MTFASHFFEGTRTYRWYRQPSKNIFTAAKYVL